VRAERADSPDAARSAFLPEDNDTSSIPLRSLVIAFIVNRSRTRATIQIPPGQTIVLDSVCVTRSGLSPFFFPFPVEKRIDDAS